MPRHPLPSPVRPPARQPPPADARLDRVRRLARLLDRSIPLGGGRRIGLDPLLGLLPGGGDLIGACLSGYILFQGVRLGLPAPVLLRMLGNIVLETSIGAIPLLGDLFDFVWQANMRNLRLIERHHRPEKPGRPRGGIILVFLIAAIALLALVAALTWWLVDWLWSLLPI